MPGGSKLGRWGWRESAGKAEGSPSPNASWVGGSVPAVAACVRGLREGAMHKDSPLLACCNWLNPYFSLCLGQELGRSCQLYGA